VLLRLARATALGVLALVTLPAHSAKVSQPGDLQCGSAFEFIGPDPAVAARAKASGQPVYVVADSSEATTGGEMQLHGQAAIVKGDRQLNADDVTYNRDSQAAVATGAVVFGDSRMMLEGTSLEYNLDADQGTIENASYALREKRARGRATRYRAQGCEPAHAGRRVLYHLPSRQA